LSLSGVGMTTNGRVRVISDPQEFNSRINGDAFPPVMSYFQPDKATMSGVSFVNAQRKRFRQLVEDATVVAIVGVRVRPSDHHIWDALQHTAAKLVYCSGSEGGEEFLGWKQVARPSLEDKVFHGYFKESLDGLCTELNLR